MMHIARTILASLAASAATATLCAQVSVGGGYVPSAPTADAIPELEGVTIIDKLDSQLPLSATFRDDHGNAFRCIDDWNACRQSSKCHSVVACKRIGCGWRQHHCDRYARGCCRAWWCGCKPVIQ